MGHKALAKLFVGGQVSWLVYVQPSQLAFECRVLGTKALELRDRIHRGAAVGRRPCLQQCMPQSPVDQRRQAPRLTDVTMPSGTASDWARATPTTARAESSSPT
jgi:hypothetical protein